jgi:hypothetical protein
MNIADETAELHTIGEARTSARLEPSEAQATDGGNPDAPAAPLTAATVKQAQARAEKVCAMILAAGKTDGRFSMAVTTLRRAAAGDLGDVSEAVAGAVRNKWMRRAGANRVELTAAGIYVAKNALDLPR